MISLTRSEYSYATLAASEEEWRAIQAILNAAVEKYLNTELDTFLSDPPDTRRRRVTDLAELFRGLDRPKDDLSRSDIQVLRIIIDAMEHITVEGIAKTVHKDITQQFDRLPSVSMLFDGYWEF